MSEVDDCGKSQVNLPRGSSVDIFVIDASRPHVKTALKYMSNRNDYLLDPPPYKTQPVAGQIWQHDTAAEQQVLVGRYLYR